MYAFYAYFFRFVCFMFCPHVCKCNRCIPSVHRDQKRLSDPSELQMAVRSGNQVWILSKSKRVLHYRAIFQPPVDHLLLVNQPAFILGLKAIFQ